MLHLYDRATMARVPTLDLQPRLRRLLADRIAALGDDLIDWTEFVVVQPGDTEADIVRYIGLSPLVGLFGEARFGSHAFEPAWDWLAAHDGWYELIFTFGSTFAYVVFVPDGGGAVADLVAMCRQYAGDRS